MNHRVSRISNEQFLSEETLLEVGTKVLLEVSSAHVTFEGEADKLSLTIYCDDEDRGISLNFTISTETKKTEAKELLQYIEEM